MKFRSYIIASVGFLITAGLRGELCPYGHDAVKDIPILYGLIRTSEQLQERINNHEVVLGGCVVSPDSPETQKICQECGFRRERNRSIHFGEEERDFETEIPKNIDQFRVQNFESITRYHHVVEDDEGSYFIKLISLFPGRVLTPRDLGFEVTYETPVDWGSRRLYTWKDTEKQIEIAFECEAEFGVLVIAPIGKNTMANKARDQIAGTGGATD